MEISTKNTNINSAKIHENGLFIFRRDLRIVDNTGLNLLNTKCKNIYTVFIFTPEQVTNTINSKSENALQFMIECLEVLSDDIKKNGGKLYSFYGENNKIIEDLIKQLDITIIGFNNDSSAINRDEQIIDLCEKMNVNVINANDYYERTIQQHIASPAPFRKFNFHIKNEIDSYSSIMSFNLALHKFTSNNPHLIVYGGREEAFKKINLIFKEQKKITHTHDDLNKSISELNTYIKFGCLSIREIYKKFIRNKYFTRQFIKKYIINI
jgi:deoxyribodipyrimidine photo-lyase